jgi:peptidoglycan/xylan/chitin deacetylase (PgdA/CDA1 family)
VLEPQSPGSLQAAKGAPRARRFVAALVGLLLSLSAIVAVVAVARSGAKAKHAKRMVAAHAPPTHVRPTALDGLGEAAIRRLARLGLPIYCAGQHGNEVAFTFDDGPGVYTHYALTKLTQAHERATFFVVGRSIQAWPGWLAKEAKVGAIGDHTSTHPVLTELRPAGMVAEIEPIKQKIESAIGQPVYLFRPPYGARNAVVDGVARRLGLLEIMWSVDSRDSLGADWLGIIRNVEAGLHPGAIILMHENRGQTIRALTTLLPELRRRHLRSVSVPELFATDPPSVAQVKRGEAGCAGPSHATITGS